MQGLRDMLYLYVKPTLRVGPYFQVFTIQSNRLNFTLIS
jgi:hypothetical protein